MTTRDKLLFWVIGFSLLGGFLYMVSGILLPFVVAMIAAYFLDPAADKLEKFGLSRSIATLIITGIFFVTVILMAMLLAPILYDQLLSMFRKIPEYITLANEKFLPRFSSILEQIDPDAINKAKESVSEISAYAFRFVTKVMGNIWNSGLAVVNILSLLFVTPIVTFYMLRDWDRLLEKVKGWLPADNKKVILEQAREIDKTLSGYIRGQTNVCIILGAFYGIALSLVGLEFGFAIGLATGILSFIPYVGLLFGFVVGMVIAILQFGNIIDVGIVASIFIIGQIVEGNFITPKLVGDKVGLHPVWIIFGMMAGASMFGFLGILLAIPVTAVIGVLVRFSLAQYLKSSFYKVDKPTKTPKSRKAVKSNG
ncbi:MAG: AI-2E family transporter [Alphaproteobacteria bacterium CG11_big_fil_rev_8_21_14_0_20_39_49]|nr:MAG: AI-2E family transporter [Alphaproteobacteria bacterium CG11_big_fil_rev_8_21_14_0_20_39_49]